MTIIINEMKTTIMMMNEQTTHTHSNYNTLFLSQKKKPEVKS